MFNEGEELIILESNSYKKNRTTLDFLGKLKSQHYTHS